MSNMANAFILGRREWVALPELGLSALKAKIDTGARTSALHAQRIQIIGPTSSARVRFVVHPVPERADIEVACEAALFGEREVMSTSGERERRFIIETSIKIGDKAWPIQLGLTNREMMSHRMLIGRQALLPGMLVDPGTSFLHPRLSSKLYLKRV